MAKRNKAKFASKSRKSALRIEALEQRQLLAAVTGGGTEVGSNIVHPNGNVYDQVLMTGASVTVSSDAGQVTRVSFLDLNGDIVQAEFAGKGSLTITLDQFKAAAEAAGYNQPGVKYVGGLATFTIQGEDASTNFNVFTVGSGNAINQDLFAGGKTGGTNHIADIARILIVADPTAPGGSTMGGIRAGNAIFSDSTGVVGISAANVQTQGPVVVGDIDANNAGVPTLKFGANSQFATLIVAGGDLAQTNGAVVQGSGFSSINSQAGADSTVEARPGFTPGAANINSKVIAAGAVDVDPNTAGTQAPTITTLDSITSFDLTGKTQADIDAAFNGRTFTSDITINGDLSGVNTLSAAEFRGAVTFTGTLTGNVTVSGAVKSVTLAKSAATTEVFKADSIGAFTTTGTADVAGTVVAKSIGNVTVGGSLTGYLTSDFNLNGAQNDGEKAVGNVAIAGNASGSVFGVLGIASGAAGTITVGGDVTGSTFLKTLSGSAGDAFVANIGSVTINGDARGGGSLINIAKNGTFGDVTVKGGGTDTTAHSVGTITVAELLGAAGSKTGNISITDDVSVALGAITIGNTANAGSLGSVSVKSTAGLSASTGAITFTGNGSVGDVTVTGSGLKSSLAEIGTISLTTGTAGASLGNISISNAEGSKVNAITAKSIGNITGSNVDAGGGVTRQIDLNGAITANNGTNTSTVGNITLTGRDAKITGGITTTTNASTDGTSIGTVSITGSNSITVSGDVASAKIGAITHTGSSTFADSKGYRGLNSIASFTTTASTTFNTAGGTSNVQFGTMGAMTFGGTTTFNGGVAPAILGDNSSSVLDSIASITFNGKVTSVDANLDIRASTIGNISVSAALATTESLVKNLNVYAGNNTNASTSALFSSVEAVTRDGANLGSYSIGNISVTSTNTIGITATQLFEGANSFDAIGKVGNINLQAGGSSTVQTALFKQATDSLIVQTGNGNVSANAVQHLSSGIDFDGGSGLGTVSGTAQGFGTGVAGTDETSVKFSTNVTVSVGSVTINAASKSTDGFDTINWAGGGSATTGLMVLSGAKSSNGTALHANTLAVIDTTAGEAIRGTVGAVSITNLSQQLSRSAATAIGGLTTPAFGGVIAGVGVAATTQGSTSNPIGTVQGASNGLTAGQTYVVGGAVPGDGAAANDHLGTSTGNDVIVSADEIVVIRL